MDMNQIGQLLHIHKEALAHGPMFSNIASAAFHALKQHEAEAKEEMIHVREEQKAKEAEQAEKDAEAIRAQQAEAENANEGMKARSLDQRDAQIKDEQAKVAAHQETMRKANARINPGSDGTTQSKPNSDPAFVQTEPQPTVLDRRL